MLLTLDHPNILKLHEIYLDHIYIHLVTELLPGGSIYQCKNKKGKFSEAEAANIIRQSLYALNYLHGNKVVHRDLKTENILLCQNQEFVKLIDFGFAKLLKKRELKQTLGTPYYMAPEVIEGVYDLRCDLWSIGVITFEMLSGKLPFMAKTNEALEEKILSCDYDIDQLTGVSRDAKKFIESLIEKDMDMRMTCEEALNHSWIVKNSTSITDE